jgi:hypothetical protein
MTTTDIVTGIDRRLAEAKAEIAQLEGARQALSNGAAPSATPTPRGTQPKTAPPKTAPRKTAVRKTAARRAARRGHEVVPAGKLTALLDGSTGMSTPELAKATNGKPDQILALLRELEKTDQIRRTGERRATRWHLITDEDRIAARAAEIAAQSRRRRKTAA